MSVLPIVLTVFVTATVVLAAVFGAYKIFVQNGQLEAYKSVLKNLHYEHSTVVKELEHKISENKAIKAVIEQTQSKPLVALLSDQQAIGLANTVVAYLDAQIKKPDQLN